MNYRSVPEISDSWLTLYINDLTMLISNSFIVIVFDQTQKPIDWIVHSSGATIHFQPDGRIEPSIKLAPFRSHLLILTSLSPLEDHRSHGSIVKS